MLIHPIEYQKRYYDFIAQLEKDHNIDPNDPMYDDRIDEAFNAMQDELMMDLGGNRPLS